MTDDNADLAHLADLLYEAAADPALGQVFVDAIYRFLGGTYVQLHAYDYVSGLNIGFVAAHHSPDFIRPPRDDFNRPPPVVPALLSAPVGQVFRTGDWAVADEPSDNELLFPPDDRATGCGAVLYRDARRLFIFGAHLPGEETARRMSEVQQVVDHLVPHVRRAMRVHRLASRIRAVKSEYATALDRVSDAVFHLDTAACVRWMNTSARLLCAAGGRFGVDPLGRIVTGDENLSQRIYDYCAEPRTRVERFVADQRDNGGPLLVGHMIAPANASNTWNTQEPATQAILCLQSISAGEDWAMLVNHFQFTPTEAALAGDLLRGLALKELAERRGTSIHTIRNQLRSLMDKTGTRRQSELVALLAPFSIRMGDR